MHELLARPRHLGVDASGSLNKHFYQCVVFYLGICLAVKRSPSAAHNYNTASLASYAPSFISQQLLTIFTLQRCAAEWRWCSLSSLLCPPCSHLL